MVTRQQLIEKIKRLPEDKLKELSDLIEYIEGQDIGQDQAGLTESGMENYLQQLMAYEDMLASGKIVWK